MKHSLTRLYDAIQSKQVNNKEGLLKRLTWYSVFENKMDPIFCHMLEDGEIDILADWFVDTTNKPYLGETGFPMASMISTLLTTNNVTSVVQLGHYAGFSSIVIGMLLRKISADARLVSFDIDNKMTEYCSLWMKRAGLESTVKHFCMDSSDPKTLQIAAAHLNSKPQLVFIDASKQYHNTLKEISLWSPHTTGYIIAHDVSRIATSHDSNSDKGVGDGLRDSKAFKDYELLTLDPHKEIDNTFPYLDPCGIGIGLVSGKEILPSATDWREVFAARNIVSSEKLNEKANWFFDGNYYEYDSRKIVKHKGYSGFAKCFAPIQPQQRLRVKIQIARFSGDGVVVCAGGDRGTSFVATGNGVHEGEFVAGEENSFVAVYGSERTEFEIVFFEVIEIH